MKYNDILVLANENKEIFKKLLEKLKKDKNKKADLIFSDLHVQTFQKIDCLECANCCKTTSPIFRDIDIKRISKKMKLAEKNFISNYLKLDDEKDYVLKNSPCVFLGNDNKCNIYDIRPLACKEFPHTDRKNIYQITDITYLNSQICPAVSNILLQFQKKAIQK
ncbi:MAG: YkgJ family cysteine cluster protein [Flavobacteriia bacterium]|nr:YkgJ family cysteine cluster protein [Flavobacteriia bacterium]